MRSWIRKWGHISLLGASRWIPVDYWVSWCLFERARGLNFFGNSIRYGGFDLYNTNGQIIGSNFLIFLILRICLVICTPRGKIGPHITFSRPKHAIMVFLGSPHSNHTILDPRRIIYLCANHNPNPCSGAHHGITLSLGVCIMFHKILFIK